MAAKKAAPSAKTKKTVSSRTLKPSNTVQPRRLKRAQYRAFRFRRRTKREVHLPNAFKLSAMTWRVFWDHRKLFLGIALIYTVLNLLLVRGFSGSTDVGSLRDSLNQVFSGHFGKFASGLTVFTVLLSANGSSSDAGGVYQLIVTVIVSLAVIWALRHVLAKERVRIRDTFYRGMYPLVPFVLVLLVVFLQLIPLISGGTLYSIAVGNGIANGNFETFLWLVLFVLLTALSVYMLCSSVFALYISTLPDMTPMKALRSARELVRYRRFPILRKLLFLPLALMVIAAVLVVPTIILAAPVAQWLFFFLSMLALVAVHIYMYLLYRELLA